MSFDLENALGFALQDVKAIWSVAIRYGEAFSQGESDARQMWDALFNLIDKLKDDLEKQVAEMDRK